MDTSMRHKKGESYSSEMSVIPVPVTSTDIISGRVKQSKHGIDRQEHDGKSEIRSLGAYPDKSNSATFKVDRLTEYGPSASCSSDTPANPTFSAFNVHYNSLCSQASDTSSAYSGSDLIQVEASLIDDETRSVAFNVSCDETISDSSEPYFCDTVKESLEKNISERTPEDIENIVDLIDFYPVFAKFSPGIRREIAKVVVLAVVPKAGTVILSDQEVYDSWTVIINGEVENLNADGTTEYTLHVGDCFGSDYSSASREYHVGVMKTLVHDCQFLCVAKSDYYRILQSSEESLKIEMDEQNNVVLVKELRKRPDGTTSEIIVKGANEILQRYLIHASATNDFVFVEDYLLTHRLFNKGGTIKLCEFLFHQFTDMANREPVANIFLTWVRCFFWDFSSNAHLRSMLDQVIALLQTEGMEASLKLLSIACTEKSLNEIIVIPRSNRTETLGFQLDGGSEKGYPAFVSWVDDMSKANELGLRRGHQVLEVNSASVDHLPLNKIVSLMKDSTHLCLTVKLNLIGFYELLRYPDRSPAKQSRLTSGISPTSTCVYGNGPTLPKSSYSQMLSCSSNDNGTRRNSGTAKNGSAKSKMFSIKGTFRRLGRHLSNSTDSSGKGFAAELGGHTNLNNVGNATSLPRDTSRLTSSGSFDASAENTSEYTSEFMPASSFASAWRVSNGGLFYDDEIPLVVKVYKADQQSRFLPVHKETTSKQVVMLALTAFEITAHSGLFALYEVSVENGVIRQKRLPERTTNLAEKLPINARYYLKDNTSMQPLITDDVAAELMQQLDLSFLNLSPYDVAAQLTLRDYSLFYKVEPSELLIHALQLDPDANTDNLKAFSDVVNEEMYWVITEIVKERSTARRARVIKHFIKIAKLCREIKNFNSLFAIVSGLDHKAVTRLETTWERVSEKSRATLQELKAILDPSKNMLQYRRLLKNTRQFPPLIPMFPLCVKDLTFVHHGNDTFVNGLVNFEKCRMLSNEIRGFIEMKSSAIDIIAMSQCPVPFYLVFTAFGYCVFEQSLNNLLERFNLVSTSNSKRLYDECMMAKRSKFYLASLDVISDEQRLLDIANYCETCCDSPDQRMDRFLFLPSIGKSRVRPSPSFYSRASGSKPVTPSSSTASSSIGGSLAFRSNRLPQRSSIDKHEISSLDKQQLKLHGIGHADKSTVSCYSGPHDDCELISYDIDSGRASLTSSDNQPDHKIGSGNITDKSAVRSRILPVKVATCNKCVYSTTAGFTSAAAPPNDFCKQPDKGDEQYRRKKSMTRTELYLPVLRRQQSFSCANEPSTNIQPENIPISNQITETKRSSQKCSSPCSSTKFNSGAERYSFRRSRASSDGNRGTVVQVSSKQLFGRGGTECSPSTTNLKN